MHLEHLIKVTSNFNIKSCPLELKINLSQHSNCHKHTTVLLSIKLPEPIVQSCKLLQAPINCLMATICLRFLLLLQPSLSNSWLNSLGTTMIPIIRSNRLSFCQLGCQKLIVYNFVGYCRRPRTIDPNNVSSVDAHGNFIPKSSFVELVGIVGGTKWELFLDQTISAVNRQKTPIIWPSIYESIF